MHPHLLPHLMGGCAKHRVKRGLLLSAAQTMFLNKTFGVAGSRRKGTLSFWYKRGKLDSTSAYLSIFDAGDGTASNNDQVYFQADSLVLNFYRGGIVGKLVTTKMFRDPTGHDHIVINWDTTQATASERAKIFNGPARISAFSTETYPTLNFDTYFGAAVLHRIGQLSYGGQFFDGVISEIHFIDGAALGPENFGRIDTRSGAWAPIAYTGDHGANGFYLPFVGDAGDAPATASEGVKDRAPIVGAHVAANNWTANNITTAEFVKDTPTNYKSGADYRGNFATLSPIDTANAAQITRGALRADQGGSSGTVSSGRATHWMRSGKFYWEVYLSSAGLAGTGNGFTAIGVAGVGPLSSGGSLASGANEWMLRDTGQRRNGGVDGGASTAAFLSANLCFCYHADTGKLWFGLNGVFAGNPAAGTGWDYIVPAPAAAAFNLYRSGSAYQTADFNFGQKPFLYTPPAGFKPVVVSAMPQSSVTRPSTAFVQAQAGGASIVAALAAKRTGWTNYVDLFKRHDSAEDFYFRFGDDAANVLPCPSTGKVAFPALAGTMYRARSLRVGAQYGVATGVVAHAGGAPTTVNDGMTTVRKVVFLFREAGGNIPVFHPDLTAGKLVYLNSLAGETTAADISNVLAGSFDIAAAMPAGNYRWLVMAQTPGLIDIFKMAGNSSADGPCLDHGFAFGELTLKRIDSANDWNRWSSIVDAENVMDEPDRFNVASVPLTAGANRLVDRTACGTKFRANQVDINAGTLIGIAIAEHPFHTGECAAQATAR